MLGYNGKFLEVNLTATTNRDTIVDDETLETFVGGRALAAKILCDHLINRWETIDPLGPENILLVLPGPLTGYIPGGRICISGKSPQSNGTLGSTIGGEFGVELRCAGYDGIIITGKADKPVYLSITDQNVEIRDAASLWGKDCKQTTAILTKECRRIFHEEHPRTGLWKEPAQLVIGPAGENMARTAIVSSKWTHAAGYGGYGAVMGSKNLKAITAKGTGPLPEPAAIAKIKTLIDKICKDNYSDPLWRRWGTGGGGYHFGADTSSEPVRNWQEEWHNQKTFGVDQFESRLWIKQNWGDFGCPTTCLKISCIRAGKYKGAITDNPDYELQAFLGPNLGIFTPEENVYLSTLIDDLGLCGIQTGSVMAFAAELYQNGILSIEDLDGINLKWGNTDAFAALAKKIAFREGVGNTLAEGALRAAQKLGKLKGKNLTDYAIQAKGVSIGAHGVRSGRSFSRAIGYACSVQGGDHSSQTDLPLDGWGSEIWTIFNDSAVLCVFSTFGFSTDSKFAFYNAVTGQDLNRKKWLSGGGIKTLQIQRALLLLGGPDLKWNPGVDDDVPKRFYEPLPSGPYKGKAADPDSTKRKVQKYYDQAGWDRDGIPTSETLEKLGLNEVDLALKRIRK